MTYQETINKGLDSHARKIIKEKKKSTVIAGHVIIFCYLRNIVVGDCTSLTLNSRGLT